MKILFLAPQPFFQERGTPIAVRLALQVLGDRVAGNESGDEIHLLTYHEGHPVSLPRVQISRISCPRFLSKFLRGVGPGISLKKLICDVLFLGAALRMVWQARRNQYQIVHAVEEAVFIALLIKVLFRIPYVYDMDSSLALQITEKWSLSKPLYPIFRWMEKMAVKNSLAVVPVCDSLAVIARTHGATQTKVLYDISLLDVKQGDESSSNEVEQSEDLRSEIGLRPDAVVILYMGNLESYQGIDLLIESFAALGNGFTNVHLVVIGGRSDHVLYYQEEVRRRGLFGRAHFIGPRPLSRLNEYLLQASILVSPRIRGNNTPMKIYSYLHSGIPLLATDLPTHTQVLDSSVAYLAAPDSQSYAEQLRRVILNPEEGKLIGQQAKRLAEKKYTYAIFKATLNEIYDRVSQKIPEPAQDRPRAVNEG